jgi:drug/metabolite transporter (DMT)-like permease
VTIAVASLAVISRLKGELLLPQSTIGWWSFLGSNLLFAGAMIGFFVGIAMIGPVKTILFSSIELLATIAVAFLILGQSLSPLQVLGVLTAVAALVMTEMVSLRDTEPAHTET